MAEHNAVAAAPARRDSRLLSMTSPSTSLAAALGCARSVTSEHAALHHLDRSESGFHATLASSNAERSLPVPHAADGLPRRGRFRSACLWDESSLFPRSMPPGLGLDLVSTEQRVDPRYFVSTLQPTFAVLAEGGASAGLDPSPME